MAKQVKLLVVGGLNGFFSAGFSKIASINKKHGPFDLLLCVGDFFGSDDDQSTGGNDELEKLMNGQIKVPLAAYIVGSKSRFPKDISEKIKSNHGEICQDLAYIGNHGVMTTIDGLRIAFLSGVSVADEDPSLPTSSERYTQASVEELIQLCTSKAAMSTLPPVTDILLTSEAPEGLSNGSSASLDIYNPKESDESRHIAQLVTALQPRYHFAGGTSGFFEREPYLNVMGAKHVTRFIRLGDFRPKTKGR
ncbi:hypothetical protein DFS34DRAFT_396038 [Phlyctochytrium arcticum]|nr:hypothetical protein DFS34DRAFT_396038 [Phlyctochytrium arcticum]